MYNYDCTKVCEYDVTPDVKLLESMRVYKTMIVCWKVYEYDIKQYVKL